MASGSIRSAHRPALAALVALALLSPLAGQAHAEPGALDHYLLALSWQPAFCQYHPGLSECPSESSVAGQATGQLTLHGLWPNDAGGSGLSYCGVDRAQRELGERRQWCDIAEPAISSASRSSIDAVMPGAKSCLDRHQWLKHGTCSGLDQDTYFGLAAGFAADIARSEIGRELAAAAGGVIASQRLRAVFEDRFGPGSGRALSLRCRKDGGRSYLAALWIRLLPAIKGRDPARTTLENDLLDSRGQGGDRSCPALIYIDAPGL